MLQLIELVRLRRVEWVERLLLHRWTVSQEVLVLEARGLMSVGLAPKEIDLILEHVVVTIEQPNLR